MYKKQRCKALLFDVFINKITKNIEFKRLFAFCVDCCYI